MNRYEIESPSWQTLLGHVLKDYMIGKGFDVGTESLFLPKTEKSLVADTGKESVAEGYEAAHNNGSVSTRVEQRKVSPREKIESIILTRRREQRDFFPADGLDCLSRHNLLLFHQLPLEPSYLHLMTDYFWDYVQMQGGRVKSHAPSFMIVAPFASPSFDGMPGLTQIMPGVYQYNEVLNQFMVVVIERLMDIPENLVWRLFSFDPEKVGQALGAYRPNRPAGKLSLPTLAEKYEEMGILNR